MRVFAYCRTSTVAQTTESQIHEINMAGFKIPSHRVISENISGSTNASEREKFKLLINKLEHGDVLVVTKLDRLGRNATDIVNTISKLTDMGVRVNVLQMGGIDGVVSENVKNRTLSLLKRS